jgi:hypothetical protein
MIILKLMKIRFDAAEEVGILTARLVVAQRAARDTANALADALMRESSGRLCKILALENPPKRKASGRQKARNGPR